MINPHILSATISKTTLIKSFIVLCILLCTAGQKTAAQGWELFFENEEDQTQHFAWQSYAIGDGNYFTYELGIFNNYQRSVYLHKINPYGELIWSKEIAGTNITPIVYDPFIQCGIDEYITAYNEYSISPTNSFQLFIMKFDVEGNTIWKQEIFPGIDKEKYINSWISAPDGGVYFSASTKVGFSPAVHFFGKISCDGNLEFFNELAAPTPLSLDKLGYLENQLYVFGRQIYPLSSGKFSFAKIDISGALTEIKVIDGFTRTQGSVLAPNNTIAFIQNDEDKLTQVKVNIDGAILSEDIIYEGDDLNQYSLVDNVGDGLIITGRRDPIGPNGIITGFAMKTNYDGELLWSKFYDHRNLDNNLSGAICATGGGYILTGTSESSEGYIIKVDEMGNIYSNSLFGKVSRDIDMDCDTSAVDTPIANWLVTAEKAGDTFIGSTDSMGNYFIPIDTGTYVVSCLFPNDYWTSCSNDSTIIIPDFDNVLNINYSISSSIDCPLMTIDGNTPFLRPCFDRPAFFQYCNQGTVTAVDAKIEITLDPAVTATASSIPWTSQVGNTYIFELGDLEPLACGNFAMSLFLDCDASLGNSYSVKAQAFPDTLCTFPDPLYSGAFIELSGICDNEEIIFTIKNIGDQPMDNPVPYIIVEDAVLGYVDDVQLLAGELVDIPLSSNGSTFTLLAGQVANAPGNSNPLLVLEGCGTNEQGEYSIGYSNQFGLDDGLPACDLDLVEARNSFDPNAKSAYPEGYSSMHYIQPNTPLEYTLYFQNTGSDTAFTVVLRDTLDQWLELSSFTAGASSHAYSYRFEENRTLKFTFENINLPDSTTNQLGSNGYVSFKINPKASTPLSTIIKNEAAIFFDYNAPIITNETFHTIAEDFIEVIIDNTTELQDSNIDINVRPNPFIDQTVISIQNHVANNYQLRIYDLQGRLVRQEVHNSPDIVLRKKAITDGIYFYQIKSDKGLSASGRLIVR